MIGPIPMPSKELPPLLPSVDSLLFLLLLFPPSPPSFPLLSPRIQQHSLWSKLSPPMQTPAFHLFHQWHAKHTSPPIQFHAPISYPMLHLTHKNPSVTKSKKPPRLSKKDGSPQISTLITLVLLQTTGNLSNASAPNTSLEPSQIINLTVLHVLNLRNHTCPPSTSEITFGTLNHRQALLKTPLLHHNQALTLPSLCLNFIELAQKLAEPQVQITPQWKHYDASHIQSSDTSSLIIINDCHDL